MSQLTVEEKIRKAHKDVMSNRYTYTLGGPIMLGDTTIDDTVPTACTNGRDKMYGREFMDKRTQAEATGIVMHEAVHVLLRHIPRHMDLIKEDPKLANAAMDYADNAYIRGLTGYGDWFVLPDGHLYDEQFENWSVRNIYNFLKKGRNPDKPEEQPTQPSRKQDEKGNESVEVSGKSYDLETGDSHDPTMIEDMTEEQQEDLDKKINQAIQEASVLAGVMGADLPKQISELLNPEPDFKTVTQEFFQSTTRGTDEYTFRQFNRKRLADNLYRPSTYCERLGRVIIANDTSGSIGGEAMAKWLDWMAYLCDQCSPDEVQVLWWDSRVVGDQTLTGSYSNLREVLKPIGGGGTVVSSVAEYIKAEHIEADCVIVFTDGYTESDIKWDINIPTLWIVTDNLSFKPPVGRVVNFK